MILDMAGASTALAILLFLWFMPLALFLLTTQLVGAEKYNWALLLIALTWPGFALYLFMRTGGGRHS